MRRSAQARRLATVLLASLLALSFSGCDPREWFVCAIGACGPAFDETPPDRPRELAAVSGDGRVTLTWAHSQPPDFRHYTVYRAAPGEGFASHGIAFDRGFSDVGLPNETTYRYKVTATDLANNESAFSAEVEATPRLPLPSAPLAAPTLTGTPFFDSVRLQWSAVAGARSYRLYKSTTAGGPYGLLAETIVSFHVDRDVLPATAYHYVVAAVDDSGREGIYSNEVSLAPSSNPGPELAYVTSWGSFGEQAGQFRQPTGIATDSARNVYVADNPVEVSRIQRFTSAGTFVGAWFVIGRTGGVAVGPDNSVYVALPLSNAVRKYTTDGEFLLQWGTAGSGNGEFQNPTGLAVDSAGNVFVADTGNQRVQKFSSTGTYLAQWAVAGDPVGVATDAAGNVYTISRAGHRVRKFTNAGVPVTEWGAQGSGDAQFEAPEGIGVDAADRVWVTDTGNDRVHAFSTGGVRLFAFGATGSGASGFEAPNAVAGDCASYVYILDAGNSRVKKYGPSTPLTCPPLPRLALPGPAPAFAAGARPGFSATLKTIASTPGKVTTSKGVTRERGARARGTFAGRSARAPRAFKAFARGTWRARFDVAVDPKTRRGTAKGLVLATAKRKRGGRLCLSFKLKLAGTKVSGTFTTVGGSGPARRLRAGGSFTERLGANAGFTLSGRAAPGRGTRGLSRACRRL
jgi:sugar lactone lactonase YvrE